MGVFIKRFIDVPFDTVFASVSPCLYDEGFHLMSDVKAQNACRERLYIGLRRFVIFQNRLNKVLQSSDNSTGNPTLRVSSNVTLSEQDGGGTKIVGYDPTLPYRVDDEDLDTSRRNARQLRLEIEDALRSSMNA